MADQSRVEALVYFVVSPEDGPGHRIYEEEDILARGGVHAAERVLENENYWYGYLGRVWGEPSPRGVTYQDSEFARLPAPNQTIMKIGRRNPALEGQTWRGTSFKRPSRLSTECSTRGISSRRGLWTHTL